MSELINLSELLNKSDLPASKKRSIRQKLNDEKYRLMLEIKESGKTKTIYLNERGQKWMEYIITHYPLGFDQAEIHYLSQENERIRQDIKVLSDTCLTGKNELYDPQQLCLCLEMQPGQLKRAIAKMKKEFSEGFESLDPVLINQKGLDWLGLNLFPKRYCWILRKEYHTLCYVLEKLEQKYERGGD